MEQPAEEPHASLEARLLASAASRMAASRISREFGVVNLKVEPLQALAACDKLCFAESDGHQQRLLLHHLHNALGIPLKDWFQHVEAANRQDRYTLRDAVAAD